MKVECPTGSGAPLNLWQVAAEIFYEYVHGDDGSGIGASHQTGWTGLVAKLLQQSGE